MFTGTITLLLVLGDNTQHLHDQFHFYSLHNIHVRVKCATEKISMSQA